MRVELTGTLLTFFESGFVSGVKYSRLRGDAPQPLTLPRPVKGLLIGDVMSPPLTKEG